MQNQSCSNRTSSDCSHEGEVPQAAQMLFPRWWCQDRVSLLKAILHLEDAHPTIQHSEQPEACREEFSSTRSSFQVPWHLPRNLPNGMYRPSFRRVRMQWTPPPAGCKILQIELSSFVKKIPTKRYEKSESFKRRFGCPRRSELWNSVPYVLPSWLW
jgi:hypothetical protein